MRQSNPRTWPTGEHEAIAFDRVGDLESGKYFPNRGDRPKNDRLLLDICVVAQRPPYHPQDATAHLVPRRREHGRIPQNNQCRREPFIPGASPGSEGRVAQPRVLPGFGLQRR